MIHNKNNNKELVSDLSKNKIKWIRSLHQKKTRDELGFFIVEGEKMVNEALIYAKDFIELLVYTNEFNFEAISCESYEITAKELNQISLLTTPNKVLAVVRKIKTNSAIQKDNLIIALDGIQDPGNLGTIMRIADWYGISDIICSKTTVDWYNPKVVQSSMGAIFRVNMHTVELRDWLMNCELNIYGALLEGKNIYQETLPEKGVLVLGNEGNGISQELLPLITDAISIPRFGGAESLNVSVAAAILVSEFKRPQFQKK